MYTVRSPQREYELDDVDVGVCADDQVAMARLSTCPSSISTPANSGQLQLSYEPTT